MYRKNSIYYRWIVSYLVLLCFPLLMNMYLYNHNLNTLRNEVINSNRVIVENMQQNVDNIFSEAERLFTQISLNNTVSSVLLNDEITKDTQIAMRNVMVDLNSYHKANNYINSFYLYCKRTDIIISPDHILNRTDFLDLEQQVSSVDYRNISNVLLNLNGSSNFMINSSDENSEIFAIAQSIPLVSDEASGVVIILLDKEKLLANFDPENSSGFYIADKNSSLLPVFQPKAEIDTKLLAQAGSESTLNIENEKIHIIKTRSSTTGRSYISVVSDSLIVDKLFSTKIIISIFFALFLIIGIFLSYTLLRLNYKPFERLISVIEQNSGSHYDSSVTEYTFIEDTVKKISGKQMELNRYIRHQDNLLKTNFINRMLKEGSGIATEETLAKYEIDIVSDDVIVGLIHFSSLANLFHGENLSEHEIYNYAVLIVTNITKELLAGLGTVLFTVIDKSVAFAVIVKEEYKASILQKATDLINDSANFVQENFHFGFYSAISNVHSFSRLHIAYQEAMTAMEYKSTDPSARVLLYKDLKLSNSSDYYYPSITEKQLINFVKNSDILSSEKLINKIFTDCRNSPALLKVLIYDIAGTLIRTMTEIYDEKSPCFDEIMPLIDKLSVCQDTNELKDIVSLVLKRVCENIANKATKSIGEIVQECIWENYHDPMLSVSMIASKVNMHPNYLSTVFKEQMGFNILEYITEVRIDTAKKLLKENELTIDKIASLVGYTNSHTFTRAFKKLENITPSAYRKGHKDSV